MLKQKTIFGASAAIIVAAILFINFFQKGQRVTDNSSQQATTTTSLQTDGVDLSPDAIAEWTTCQNEKYGYEFKYPNGWHIYKYTSEGEMRYVTEVDTCDIADGTIVVSEAPSKGSGIPSRINLDIETSDAWLQWVRQFSSTQEQYSIPYSIQYDTINGRSVTYYYNAGTVYAAVADGGNMVVLRVSADTGGKLLASIPLDPSRLERVLLNAVLPTLKLLK